MTDTFPFQFHAPVSGVLATVITAATILLVFWRRPALPATALACAGAGAVLLALAAAGTTWQRRHAGPVAVLVDLSPSTRTAGYRDPAALRRRVEELIGSRPYEIRAFADGWGAADLAAAALADLPADRTNLPEVAGSAILLFSDGRLAAPAGLPPTYCVIDRRLDDVPDAAVTSLDVRADAAVVTLRNGGAGRALALRGMDEPATVQAPPGEFSVARRFTPDASALSASFPPGDAWPENDTLRVVPPPPAQMQRWWVGASDPPDGWTRVSPGQLPGDVSRFLPASVVVLDNIPADALDPSRLDALHRYVRDLGGGLVILGGDRAFAAGGYAGTQLDALSPLASDPPEPATHWLLVADASGSMNQEVASPDAGRRTRWQYAADSLTTLARQLPPADLLSIGSFAQELRWWSQARPVEETRTLPLPPPDVSPRGPTNLDAALRRIAEAGDASLPRQLLIATDANAQITDAAALGARLQSRQVRLHVLLLGEPDASGLPALQSIVAATSGSLREERLPENWAAGLRELMRAAQPPRVEREPIEVRYAGELERAAIAAGARAGTTADVWNHTWPKDSAAILARADPLTLAARWNVGAGQVAAAAFAMSAQGVGPLADLVARAPRDPRFRLAWATGRPLRLTIDAADGARLLNGETFFLDLRPASRPGAPTVQPIPQTGPGRYALAVEPTREPLIATVRHDQRILDTVAVAERYAPEFDAIGNDRPALTALAQRSGGAVIEPGVTRRLDLPSPRRPVPLVSYLATGAAALVAAGLVRWRLGS